MSYRFPNFAAAQQLLERHRDAFLREPGVVGVGVAQRQGRMVFVVTIDHVQARERFARLAEIEGLPIQFEVATLAAATR